jgi:excisionase family DNA binding protein
MSTAGQDGRKAGQQAKPQFFTIAEIAQRLNVSKRTVHRWIANYELIVHRIGRSVRVSDTDFRAFLTVHRGED